MADLRPLPLIGLLPLVLSSPVVAAPAPRPVPAPQVPLDTPTARLEAAAFTQGARPPRVLYTWTTPDQIEALRQTPTLLTRTESPRYGQTTYAIRLHEHAASAQHPISQLLAQPEFARHRYAWHQPWATLLGWYGESYGEQLIRVELKPEAWVGLFTPDAATPWRFVDLEGHPVPIAAVLQSPQRIGAVFHFKEKSAPENSFMATFGLGRESYREFILCNEGMIARWEHGTPAISAELAQEVALLEALRPLLEAPAAAQPVGAWMERAVQRWSRDTAARSLLDTYTDTLAFPNNYYHPTPENLDALVARLGAARAVQSAPLSHAVGAP